MDTRKAVISARCENDLAARWRTPWVQPRDPCKKLRDRALMPPLNTVGIAVEEVGARPDAHRDRVGIVPFSSNVNSDWRSV
jgi:hypothetical protein